MGGAEGAALGAGEGESAGDGAGMASADGEGVAAGELAAVGVCAQAVKRTIQIKKYDTAVRKRFIINSCGMSLTTSIA